MIATRATSRLPVPPTPSPRLHALAKLAMVRIDAGFDPRESILAALVAATDGPGLPSCYDHLTPLQREVVLVVWSNGDTRMAALITALGRTKSRVWGLAKHLVNNGVLVRPRKGIYRMNPESPTIRANPGSLVVNEKLVAELRARGPTHTNEMARLFNVHRDTMHKRLKALAARGLAVRQARAIYAPVEPPT